MHESSALRLNWFPLYFTVSYHQCHIDKTCSKYLLNHIICLDRSGISCCCTWLDRTWTWWCSENYWTSSAVNYTWETIFRRHHQPSSCPRYTLRTNCACIKRQKLKRYHSNILDSHFGNCQRWNQSNHVATLVADKKENMDCMGGFYKLVLQVYQSNISPLLDKLLVI